MAHTIYFLKMIRDTETKYIVAGNLGVDIVVIRFQIINDLQQFAEEIYVFLN